MSGLGARQIVLVLAALGLIIVAVAATGVVPAEALQRFVQGAVGGPAAWRKTLREATPLLIAGTAVFLALRAGLFNIGADGQLTVGAVSAAAVALAVPGPFGAALACLAGVGAGALWAWPAGWIRAYRGGHEVISSIMLNNIALALTLGLAKGPLKNPEQQEASTRLLAASSHMPDIVSAPPFRVNLGLAVGLAAMAAVVVWMGRTVGGFELRAAGANPGAAAVAGVDVKRVQVRAMAFSGGLAGLAGAVLVLGFERRFYADFSPGFGFDALGVALLAGGSGWGLVPSSLLFAFLSAGTTAVQTLGIPRGLSGVLLGLTILVFAAFRYRRVRHGGD